MPYPTDHETLTAFFAARVHEDHTGALSNAQLHSALASWCAHKCVPAISSKAASQYLLRRGYRQAGSRTHGRAWAGLALTESPLPK